MDAFDAVLSFVCVLCALCTHSQATFTSSATIIEHLAINLSVTEVTDFTSKLCFKVSETIGIVRK